MEPDAPDKRAGRIARMRAAEAFGLHYDKTTTIMAGGWPPANRALDR